MSKDCFINLTTDDNIKKLDIDPRLIEPFKRVMYKIQEYFNMYGYSDIIDFENVVKNYLLPRDIVDKDILCNSPDFQKYMQEKVVAHQKLEAILTLEPRPINEEAIINEYISTHYNVGLKFKVKPLKSLGQYNYKDNSISITPEHLTSSYLDQTLCHEIIHFLTMCSPKELGTISDEMSPCEYEPLTEMLATDIINHNKNYSSYLKYCELMEYVNNLSGVNNYSAFLQRRMDSKYEDWISSFDETQDVFDENRFSITPGYMSEEEMNKLLLSYTTQLLFKEFDDIKSLTDTLSMVYTAPQIYEVLDDLTDIIETIVDEFMTDKGINGIEIKNQIIALIRTKSELKMLNGKEYAKIKVKDQVYLIDKVGNIYLETINNVFKIDGGNIDMSFFVDNEILTINVSDGTVQKYKLSDIDYNALEQYLVNKQATLETSLSNILCSNQEIRYSQSRENNDTSKSITIPYIRKDVRDKVISRTESSQYKEQEQTSLKRPYIRHEIVATIINRDIKKIEDEKQKIDFQIRQSKIAEEKAISEEQKRVLLEQKAIEQDLEEDLDRGMSM